MSGPAAVLCALALGVTLQAEELRLACSATKPVITPEEAIGISAFARGGENLIFEWTASGGTITGSGAQVLWRPTQPSGQFDITVRVSSSAGKQSCTVVVYVNERVTARGAVARRFMLFSAETEPQGFGLYSYLLLTRDGGDPDTAARNMAAIESWYRRILAVTPLERERERRSLNATFVPVRTRPPADPTPEWVHANYDYSAAELLLAKLRPPRTQGPVLASQPAPLTSSSIGPTLVLDMSWVPARTAGFWVQEFKNVTAQEHFDRPDAVRLLQLRLRTVISVIAEELPRVREAAASIVTVSK